MVSLRPWSLCPRTNSHRYPLNAVLCGPQFLSGHVGEGKKSPTISEIRPENLIGKSERRIQNWILFAIKVQLKENRELHSPCSRYRLSLVGSVECNNNVSCFRKWGIFLIEEVLAFQGNLCCAVLCWVVWNCVSLESVFSVPLKTWIKHYENIRTFYLCDKRSAPYYYNYFFHKKSGIFILTTLHYSFHISSRSWITCLVHA